MDMERQEVGYKFDYIINTPNGKVAVKLLEDVNTITERKAYTLRIISETANAVPLIVCKKKGGRQIDDSSLGVRYYVLYCSENALNKIICGEPVPVKEKGGDKVFMIKKESLVKKLVEEGISIKDIANRTGISRKRLYIYLRRGRFPADATAIMIREGIINKLDIENNLRIILDSFCRRPCKVYKEVSIKGYCARLTRVYNRIINFCAIRERLFVKEIRREEQYYRSVEKLVEIAEKFGVGVGVYNSKEDKLEIVVPSIQQ